MFKKRGEITIKDVYLPLAGYMRPLDKERLCRALRDRKVLRGDHNPVITRRLKETTEQFALRYRKLLVDDGSHIFFNFRLTDKGIKADLTFLDPVLIGFEGNLIFKRRAYNDIWFNAGKKDYSAPGFIGVDIFTRGY